jgi:hypothetical protein
MEVARRLWRSSGEVPKMPTLFPVYASRPIQIKDRSWEQRYTLFVRDAVNTFAAPRKSWRKGEETWKNWQDSTR